ncbi:GNAT family N-acetyltransferase [Maricaulis sp. CAU 1757]
MASSEPPVRDRKLTLRVTESLRAVSREAWDSIANPPGAAFDPFVSWDFLEALEASACVSEETGWYPRHLLAEDETGTLRGALPLYAKTHSMGEYVFDHAWAEAYQRAGGQYYPKLLTAIPFTPVTGRRILSTDAAVRSALVDAAMQTARQWGLSGWHVNFPDKADRQDLAASGLLARVDRQFVWHNRGYATYDDFLADLSSRKRKALRKERAGAQAGLLIERISGAALTPMHWDVFFACYQDTGARKWGRPYLSRDFFDLLHQRMADRVLMVMARRDGHYVAAALNLIGSEALYGRYWGCLEPHPGLHFELCYHQAVDYAIEHGLARVEAGAQGEHKLARGYRPEAVHSAHWLVDPGFRDAVGDYLAHERDAVEAEIVLLDAESPFRKGAG